MSAGDSAAASVYVAVPLEDAFEVFTSEIDLWWRRGRKFRVGGARPGRIVFEQRLGGRLFETVELPSGERSFETGSVRAVHAACAGRRVDLQASDRRGLGGRLS